jgi:hypothetical protein
MKNFFEKNWKAVLAFIAILMLVLAAVWVFVAPPEAPVPRSYTTGVYKTEGGDKLVAQSGGEIELQSGATFDLQSGVTTDFSSGIDQDLNTENVGVLPSVVSVSIDIDNDSSPATCATVADGEVWVVHTVYANVLDNFDCTGDDCTFDVGDGNDQDGLLDLDDAELQASDVDVANGAAGWQGYGSDTIGAFMAAGAGFIYAPSGAAETIDCTFAGTDLASDTADDSNDITVYIVYTRLQ